MEDIIAVKKAKNGASVFVYQANLKEVALNSLISPEKEVDRFFKEIGGEDRRFLVIIGIGNGVIVEKLIQSKLFESNIHFLIIEPFSEVRLQESTISFLAEHQDKLTFHYLKDFTPLIFSSYISRFSTVKTDFYVHPNYLRANKNKVEEVTSVLKEGISLKKIFNNTETLFAIDWVVEPLLNTRIIEKSIDINDQKNKFKGEIALLVSAGPSLYDNIPFIKKMQNSAYIFAVGPTLRPLLNNNISPDVVVSIDSSKTNFETHFKDLKYDGTLLYETLSNHSIQEQHNGRKIVSKSMTEQVSSMLYDNVFGFHQYPSVSIYTLGAIKFLGFKEVYLVGQDLALVNGDYYAKGIKNHSGTNNYMSDLVVENNNGDYVGTTKPLKVFLDFFEYLIRTFPQNELRIFNTSKHGAKIWGTEYVDPNTIIVEKCKKNISFEGTVITPKQPVDEFIKEFIDKLDQFKDYVDEANKELKRFLKTPIMKKRKQLKMLATFKEIANNEIVEKIILTKMTFIFDNIINSVIFREEKDEYNDDDLREISKEISTLYATILKYVDLILTDPRILNLKKEFELK